MNSDSAETAAPSAPFSPSRARNMTGLQAHAQTKRREARRQVDQAIQDLVKRHEAVSFHRVAAVAGVSKSYLYAQRELRERIELLRRQSGTRGTHAISDGGVRELEPGDGVGAVTERGKAVLLAAKQRRIEALEAENRRLKEELRVALGKLYAQT